MTGASTNATDDVGGEVFLFGAVVLPMSDAAAVLANLIFVVAKGSVERGKLAKLVSLVVVLALGCRSGLEEE